MIQMIWKTFFSLRLANQILQMFSDPLFNYQSGTELLQLKIAGYEISADTLISSIGPELVRIFSQVLQDPSVSQNSQNPRSLQMSEISDSSQSEQLEMNISSNLDLLYEILDSKSGLKFIKCFNRTFFYTLMKYAKFCPDVFRKFGRKALENENICFVLKQFLISSMEAAFVQENFIENANDVFLNFLSELVMTFPTKIKESTEFIKYNWIFTLITTISSIAPRSGSLEHFQLINSLCHCCSIQYDIQFNLEKEKTGKNDQNDLILKSGDCPCFPIEMILSALMNDTQNDQNCALIIKAIRYLISNPLSKDFVLSPETLSQMEGILLKENDQIFLTKIKNDYSNMTLNINTINPIDMICFRESKIQTIKLITQMIISHKECLKVWGPRGIEALGRALTSERSWRKAFEILKMIIKVFTIHESSHVKSGFLGILKAGKFNLDASLAYIKASADIKTLKKVEEIEQFFENHQSIFQSLEEISLLNKRKK